MFKSEQCSALFKKAECATDCKQGKGAYAPQPFGDYIFTMIIKEG